MTYLPDLHTYLHQSSLLIQAYPTARITTKYSLPRHSTAKQLAKQQQRQQQQQQQQTSASTTASTEPSTNPHPAREKRDPSAILTLKTFDPESGICLKYRTDKAAEVGRLMSGLGRLAKGEVIEMPSAAAPVTAGDKMEVDDPVSTPAPVAATGGGASAGGGGGRGGKKRGGKR